MYRCRIPSTGPETGIIFTLWRKCCAEEAGPEGFIALLSINSEEERIMQVRVIIEYDKETKSYSAVCPELPGCTSCGETEEETMKNIREAIQLYLEPDDRTVSSDAKVYEVVV